MATGKSAVEKAREEVEELRQKLADTQAKAQATDTAAQERIELEQLEAEKVRLQRELAFQNTAQALTSTDTADGKELLKEINAANKAAGLQPPKNDKEN